MLLVKALLAFGANINHQGLNEFTPLDLAINGQHAEVESVLLEHGAKSSAQLIGQRRHFSQVCMYMYMAIAACFVVCIIYLLKASCFVEYHFQWLWNSTCGIGVVCVWY